MFGNSLTSRICSVAGNSNCADCGARSPRWASVNLGVLLCINCSGIHRKLGVHLSQIKSLTLDNIKPEWIKSLCEIGNEVANKYYLHRLPPNLSPPPQNSLQGDMEQWIRNKYERKLYAMQQVQEPWQLLEQGLSPKDVICGPRVQEKNTDLFNFGSEPQNQSFEFDAFGIKPQTNSVATVDTNSQFQGPNNNPWAHDFWPVQGSSPLHPPPSAGASTNVRTATINSTAQPQFPEKDTEDSRSAKIEAAKDCIAKLYANPAQAGFQEPTYRQNQPSCVVQGKVDLTCSTVQEKLKSQDDFNEFNF